MRSPSRCRSRLKKTMRRMSSTASRRKFDIFTHTVPGIQTIMSEACQELQARFKLDDRIVRSNIGLLLRYWAGLQRGKGAFRCSRCAKGSGCPNEEETRHLARRYASTLGDPWGCKAGRVGARQIEHQGSELPETAGLALLSH